MELQQGSGNCGGNWDVDPIVDAFSERQPGLENPDGGLTKACNDIALTADRHHPATSRPGMLQ